MRVPRRERVRGWLLWLAAACLLGACAKPQPKPPAAARQLGPLLSLVPPGPQQIAFARPRALFQHEAVQLLWSTLVEPDKERAFIERTGVDPRRLDELVVFELAHGGYLLMARGDLSAQKVVQRAGERLMLLDVQVDEPIMRREGPSSSARYAFAALDHASVLAAKNAPPQVVAAVLARAQQSSLPRAFDAPEAAALYQQYSGAAAVLFAPRPLQLPEGTGAALLLAEERALAAVAVPQPGSFHITVDLRGNFPPSAEQNFARLAESVAHAPLGQLLGIGEIERDLRVTKSATAVTVTFTWPAQRLALGLRTLFMDDLRNLMQ